MNPPGDADPLYVLARRVLLDALEALGTQRGALILVGAQAIYLHTGPAGLSIPEYTTDADIALDPQFLCDYPRLEETIRSAGFEPDGTNVGSWVTQRALGGRGVAVMVDLLVPAAVGGPGRRGARLGAHGSKVARKVKGLEAALVDKSQKTVSALETSDARSFNIAVAGPTALLVSKLHKIADRENEQGRLGDKDALDVLRLLRGVSMESFRDAFPPLMSDKVAGPVSREAASLLERLFSEPDSTGSRMAARAAAPMEPAETTAASCAALTGDLLSALRKG
ncbi:MAG: hypothetical protein A2X36_12710 [Elusimicrobia bacterium GWA2_69_24]|nr:MAG: hypothetical protein A2X36_12710 [Elusimicrobia bacterium GWA2_69_24]